MKILNNLFSIKNSDNHKILTVFGIKIKFLKKQCYSSIINELQERLDYAEARLDNIFYELKDERTLDNVKLPIIKSKKETLEKLVCSESSICRYGDGEFAIMLLNSSPGFQNPDEKLIERLFEVLNSNDDNILIAIGDSLGCLNSYKDKTVKHCRKFYSKSRALIYGILDFNRVYYDARVTRPFVAELFTENTQSYFDMFKKLWDKKDIVIVEGENTRFGVGNYLMDNCNSITRILCPAQNAFDKYDEILNQCLKIQGDKLFILALGPTATVLAYDLAKKGKRALDVGHLDIEYEWYKQNASTQIKIAGKSVNEAGLNDNVEECTDENYLKQILVKIKTGEIL